MNRRTALMLTLLSGGLWPARALAQQGRGGGEADVPRPRRRAASPPEAGDLEAEEIPPPIGPPGEESVPDGFPTERGSSWRAFDISGYTGLPHSSDTNPQNALIEWVFRRTGSSVWHGEKIAVLCASRAQLRAYHSAAILKQVAEMVERFTDATADLLSLRVRIIAAADPRWRYVHHTRLSLRESGPQGQQVWSLGVQDAATILAQMTIDQRFRALYDKTTRLVNGQTLTVRVDAKPSIHYIVGPQRESAVGHGFQPGHGQLDEGVALRISPLLTFEGDAVEAAIDLKASLVRKLHPTKVLVRREIGPADMTIDVPEASESRLNRTVKWDLGQTLLISAGIQPGILQAKSGFLNLRIPGTVPTTTELLVFLDVEAVSDAPRSARARD